MKEVQKLCWFHEQEGRGKRKVIDTRVVCELCNDRIEMIEEHNFKDIQNGMDNHLQSRELSCESFLRVTHSETDVGGVLLELLIHFRSPPLGLSEMNRPADKDRVLLDNEYDKL